MPLDPAPAVLGEDDAAADEARIRVIAAQQWRRRRDLERRLHDGAALRVSALALQLGLLRHRRPVDERELAAAVDALQDELHLVLQELRDVAGRLYPPLLDEAGLGPALLEAAGRCPVPVRVDAPDERFDAAVEGAVYFALLGCLPGATEPGREHGRDGLRGPVAARPVEIVLRREDDDLVVLVSGVPACHASAILDGIRLLGGTVAVQEPASDLSIEPATITARIPCA
jgi:Histidine kinase